METIGALASVVLLFLNARPVVSDERSEEFRRSVKEKGRRPTEATMAKNWNGADAGKVELKALLPEADRAKLDGVLLLAAHDDPL